jgi:hypothetical protein
MAHTSALYDPVGYGDGDQAPESKTDCGFIGKNRDILSDPLA